MWLSASVAYHEEKGRDRKTVRRNRESKLWNFRAVVSSTALFLKWYHAQSTSRNRPSEHCVQAENLNRRNRAAVSVNGGKYAKPVTEVCTTHNPEILPIETLPNVKTILTLCGDSNTKNYFGIYRAVFDLAEVQDFSRTNGPRFAWSRF